VFAAMWIFLSLLAGLADALRDAASKKAALQLPHPIVTLSYSLCALPFFIPTLIINMPDAVPPIFWLFLTFTASCHVVGGLLLVKALHSSDLSLCTPMVAFTPVFLLVVGPLLTGDTPSTGGVLGALLVATGSYVLNVGRSRRGFLAPLKALIDEPGSRIMLGLALLWSVTASVDRVALRLFELNFWASAQLCAIALFLLPIVLRSGGFAVKWSPRAMTMLMALGAFNALSISGYLLALKVAPVHYVICLKRCSILFSVLLGRLMFKESFLVDRLPGALLMLLGVVVITLLGN